MAPKRKSDVWRYYEKRLDGTAQCRFCNKRLKTSGNTSNLQGHLKKVHPKSAECTSSTSRIVSSHNQTEEIASTSSHIDNEQCIQSEDDNEEVSLNIVSSQPPINSFFQEIESYSTGAKANKITNSILFMICKDYQPISIVSNEGFREFLKCTVPHYKIPHRSTITRLLDSKFQALSSVFKQKLSKLNYLTVTTDIWTDTMQARSFMGITVHYSESAHMKTATLGVQQLEERHTGSYLANILTNTLLSWGIDIDQITAVVTDNGANMVSAVEIAFGKHRHLSCFAHTINLVAEKAIGAVPDLDAILGKVKRIVTWFKHSIVANDELRKMGNDNVKLIQDCPTRWNSKFYMIERFIELHKTVNEILIHHTTAPPMVSGLEIEQLKEIMNILGTLEAVTKEISGEKYVTASTVIPMVHCLKDKLINTVTHNVVATSLKNAVLKECQKRFGEIENSYILAVSTLLDPRFKKMHFKDPLACADAVKHLQELMQKEPAAKETVSVAANTQPTTSIWSMHRNMLQKYQETASTSDTRQDEVSLFLRSPPCDFDKKPLEIWDAQATSYPELAKFATKFLTIVATSVPSERLFSKAGQTLTQQRNRLKGKNLSQLLFLQSLDKKSWDLG